MLNNLLFVKPNPFDFEAIFGNILSEWYFYVALVVIVVSVVLFAIFKDGYRNALSHTQKLVYCALFSALCFLANWFTIDIIPKVWQFSFIALVGFLSGYILGAGWGFAAAFVGDLICGIIRPTGVYNPIIGIGTAMWGLIPGIVFALNGKRKYLKTIISFSVCFILSSCLINTLGIALMYQMSFTKLLYLLPYKLLGVVINFAICLPLVVLLPKILPKDKFFI